MANQWSQSTCLHNNDMTPTCSNNWTKMQHRTVCTRALCWMACHYLKESADVLPLMMPWTLFWAICLYYSWSFKSFEYLFQEIDMKLLYQGTGNEISPIICSRLYFLLPTILLVCPLGLIKCGNKSRLLGDTIVESSLCSLCFLCLFRMGWYGLVWYVRNSVKVFCTSS